MSQINRYLSHAFRSENRIKGLFLVELLVVLGLLTIVLSIGYMLFSFGYNSFFIAEARSDVNQNVRTAANFISMNIRNATEVTLWDSSVTIPDETTMEEDEHVIFINADGKVEYRTKDKAMIIPDNISDRVDFNLDLFVSTSANSILAFTLDGTRDSGQTFELTTEVFLENLAFRKASIATVGSTFDAVYYIKMPTTTLVAMSIDPNVVDENPYVSLQYEFDLSLLNETFTQELEDDPNGNITLGEDFESLSVLSATVDGTDPSKATIVLSGVLTQNLGTGQIEVSAGALAGEEDLESRVLVLIPEGILLARPSQVYEDSPFIQEFTLEVIRNTFDSVDVANDAYYELGGEFEGFDVLNITVQSDTEVTITISGDILELDGDDETAGASITLAGEAFVDDSEALTAHLLVFDADYVPELSLSVSTNGQGTTNPSGASTFASGADITLTAEPAEGWEFLKWIINGVEYTPDDENHTVNLYDQTSSVSAVAYFGLFLKDITAGSYVSYNGVDYIVLSPTRLMEKAISSNTFKWENNPAWPSKAELEGIPAASRVIAGTYWTSTAESKNNGYYVEGTTGSILSRNKNNTISRRLVLTLSSGTSDATYFNSGSGTESDPYRLIAH